MKLPTEERMGWSRAIRLCNPLPQNPELRTKETYHEGTKVRKHEMWLSRKSKLNHSIFDVSSLHGSAGGKTAAGRFASLGLECLRRVFEVGSGQIL